MGQEDGLDDEAILKRLQEKIIGLPLNRAEAYLKQYGKLPDLLSDMMTFDY